MDRSVRAGSSPVGATVFKICIMFIEWELDIIKSLEDNSIIVNIKSCWPHPRLQFAEYAAGLSNDIDDVNRKYDNADIHCFADFGVELPKKCELIQIRYIITPPISMNSSSTVSKHINESILDTAAATSFDFGIRSNQNSSDTIKNVLHYNLIKLDDEYFKEIYIESISVNEFTNRIKTYVKSLNKVDSNANINIRFILVS